MAEPSQAAATANSNNLAAASPAPSPTPDEAQLQQTINRYLAGVAKVSDAREEDKSLRTRQTPRPNGALSGNDFSRASRDENSSGAAH
jgi:hypothetical protein